MPLLHCQTKVKLHLKKIENDGVKEVVLPKPSNQT